MKKTGQLDVYEYAKTLVNSRPHLIDSVDQYQFIYEALAEAVMCNVQPIQMHQLKDRSSMYKAKKNRELMESQDNHENKLLLNLTHPLRIGDCAGGHRLENRGKNRDVMVVPPDHARPYLQTLHGESKDYTYINAVEVDGFTRKAEFIVTEWPKHSTIDSFWTLIYDHSCHTVVNLSNQGNPRHYPTFIHNKGKASYGPFIVEVLNYHQYPAMTSHMVKVMKRVRQSFRLKPQYRGRLHGMGADMDSRSSTPTPVSSSSQGTTRLPPPRRRRLSRSADILQYQDPFKEKGAADIKRLLNIRREKNDLQKETTKQIQKLTFMISDIMSSGSSNQQIDTEVRVCCVIQVRMWPIENKVPLSTTGLMDVIKMARSWRRRAPDRPETKPTIVMSHNGVSRVGVYIGANICIDQMDTDHEVDVFHAVKMMRINRPQLIDMKDEYKYLYDVMLHWYMTNPEYRIYDKEDTVEEDGSRPSSVRQSLRDKDRWLRGQNSVRKEPRKSADNN
ncbi:Protein-tyrosine phosphatase [Necator americanus]|uniref:Protein-tyrosine phosphatase n=1 Tax=Necator americanus TaxID=51031 RepID=W2TRL9_NECAM|nr:Protein-tyrosine phosphatase [Necator americanus]ETN84299.1 Protein-tyrosine phosphatase [Necator americanus]